MTLTERMLKFERRAVRVLLRKAKGRMTHAARLAGRNRTNFYRLVKRHNLDQHDFKKSNTDQVAREAQPQQ